MRANVYVPDEWIDIFEEYTNACGFSKQQLAQKIVEEALKDMPNHHDIDSFGQKLLC